MCGVAGIEGRMPEVLRVPEVTLVTLQILSFFLRFQFPSPTPLSRREAAV